ncbi:hypothetical protein U1Q18_049076, partial [Sarracenia purpurea var. burkii]
MRGRVYEMGIIRTRSRIISAYFQHLAGEVRYDATPDAENANYNTELFALEKRGWVKLTHGEKHIISSVLFIVSVEPKEIKVTLNGDEVQNGSTIGPYNEGQVISLTCEISEGKPIPSLYWYKDNKQTGECTTWSTRYAMRRRIDKDEYEPVARTWNVDVDAATRRHGRRRRRMDTFQSGKYRIRRESLLWTVKFFPPYKTYLIPSRIRENGKGREGVKRAVSLYA